MKMALQTLPSPCLTQNNAAQPRCRPKSGFLSSCGRRAPEAAAGTDVIGRQALSNVLIKRYNNQGEWTLRTDASGPQPDFAFLIPGQEPPVNSLLSPLVCFQDSSSSAGSVPAAEQQGTAPKVQLPLNV